MNSMRSISGPMLVSVLPLCVFCATATAFAQGDNAVCTQPLPDDLVGAYTSDFFLIKADADFRAPDVLEWRGVMDGDPIFHERFEAKLCARPDGETWGKLSLTVKEDLLGYPDHRVGESMKCIYSLGGWLGTLKIACGDSESAHDFPSEYDAGKTKWTFFKAQR